jgi:phospholipid transport system substrate-binding protein
MVAMRIYCNYLCKLSIFLLLAAVFSLHGERTSASANDAMTQLQKSVDAILVILQSEELKVSARKEERKQLVLELVNDMFDFQNMARSSLGQTWNTLTPEEQNRFVGLFKNLIEQRYIGKIDSFDNQKVVYHKQLVKGDRAMIYTDIVDKDLEVPIIYKLQEIDGKWLIYDMKIENVSLIVNYRRDFESIIRKEQFAGLVDKITQQIEKSETPN